MTASQQRPGNGGNGGNRTHDKRSGVDRRIADDPTYTGPERRQKVRRRLDRQPDKPLKR